MSEKEKNTEVDEEKQITGVFPLLSTHLAYTRYLQLHHRTVQFPDGRTVDFDVVSSKNDSQRFACVFPFHVETQEVTVIQEYAQGINGLLYTLPCGGFERSKHQSLEQCAREEMSEEAALCGGELVNLLPEGHPGIAEVKWCANRFTPFLVVNPETDESPRPQDSEEWIHKRRRIPLGEWESIMFERCEAMLPSISTTMLALRWLRSNGLLRP